MMKVANGLLGVAVGIVLMSACGPNDLNGISEQDIVEMNIPTGIPLVYELDAALRPIGRRYLGDQAAVEAAIQSVANQTKQKPAQ